MKLLDFTHLIEGSMPIFPGTVPATVTLAASLEAEGYRERQICIGSHTGTHIDAPSHLIAGAPSLDQLPLERFRGTAVVLDLTSTGCPDIGREVLEPHAPLLEGVSFILLHTGWDQWWGQAAYHGAFPTLTMEGARWLADFRPAGIGVDAPSVDPMNSVEYPVHRLLLERDVLILENLTGLGACPGRRFMLNCFPLLMKDADGSPVRAVGILTGDG